MKRNAAALILLAAVVAIGVIAAGRDTTKADGDRPNLSGNWELNLSKSNFGRAPKPTRMTLQAARHGDTLHAVETTYDPAGRRKVAGGDWYLDGKWRPDGPENVVTSMSKWDGKTLLSERKYKRGAYEWTRLNLSKGGRTATETVQLVTPNGENDSTLVWERR